MSTQKDIISTGYRILRKGTTYKIQRKTGFASWEDVELGPPNGLRYDSYTEALNMTNTLVDIDIKKRQSAKETWKVVAE